LLCQKEGKKIVFFEKENSRLARISKFSPREFWEYIKRYKNNNVQNKYDVDKDDLLKHFANISNVKEDQFNPSDNIDVNNDHVSVEELDCDITVDEVITNYRGITLVNVTAKVFSLILRNRINK